MFNVQIFYFFSISMFKFLFSISWEYLEKRHPGSPVVWPAWDNLALDLSSNETWPVITDVLRDVIDWFPGKYIHVGGDEVNGVRNLLF